MKATVLLPVLSVVAALVFLACDGAREQYQPAPESDLAVPAGAQRIELAMGDFCFYPQELHLSAGQTVQLAIRNLGNVRHELMAGRELGGHGYEQDFFASVEVQAAGDPRRYQWEVEKEDAHGEEGEEAEADGGHGGGMAADNWSPEGEVWDCAGQVMMRADGRDYDRYAHMGAMGGRQPGTMDTDASMLDEDGAMMPEEAMEPHEGEEGAGAHGGEVWELNVDAYGTAYLTFTVPEDYRGEWEIGCFIPRHYERGMGAKFIVD